MSFGPESKNPRLRRAHAYTVVEAHRKREVPRRVAEELIAGVVENKKGRSSGLMAALNRASTYSAVENAGAAYNGSSWPKPEGSDKVHVVFRSMAADTLSRHHVECEDDPDHAYRVVIDELAARGYGIHDAGRNDRLVAAVLDRALDIDDWSDIMTEHGLIAYDDPLHRAYFI